MLPRHPVGEGDGLVDFTRFKKFPGAVELFRNITGDIGGKLFETQGVRGDVKASLSDPESVSPGFAPADKLHNHIHGGLVIGLRAHGSSLFKPDPCTQNTTMRVGNPEESPGAARRRIFSDPFLPRNPYTGEE